jgi:hypothetical protein
MAASLTAGQVQYQLDHAGDDRSSEVMVIVTTFQVLSMIFVGLRLFTRWMSRLSYWYDDYVIVFAMVRIPFPRYLERKALLTKT